MRSQSRFLNGDDIVDFLYTTSNETISHKNKITFSQFMKMIWMMSNTNLHYRDFKMVFEEDMEKMFKPVKTGGVNND